MVRAGKTLEGCTEDHTQKKSKFRGARNIKKCFLAAGSAQTPVQRIVASLSSNFFDGAVYHTGDWCIDGDTTNWCATNAQLYPYMDLNFAGGSVPLAQVVIYNRVDCCQDRANNFYLLTKNSPFEFTWPETQSVFEEFEIEMLVSASIAESNWHVQSEGTSGVYLFVPPTPVVAKFVRIIMVSNTNLNLAEVVPYTVSADQGPLVITDIRIADNAPATIPDGYNSIVCDGSCNHPLINLNVNDGAGGHTIYIFYKIAPLYTVDSFITGIMTFTGNEVCDREDQYWNYNFANGYPIDLNAGAGGDYVNLCVARASWATSTAGTPMITALQFGEGINNAGLNGYSAMSVNLNSGNRGQVIWLRWLIGTTPRNGPGVSPPPGTGGIGSGGPVY